LHRDLEIEIPVGCRPPALFVLVDELSLSELAAAPLAAPLLFPSAHQATKDDGAGRKLWTRVKLGCWPLLSSTASLELEEE